MGNSAQPGLPMRFKFQETRASLRDSACSSYLRNGHPVRAQIFGFPAKNSFEYRLRLPPLLGFIS
jgi:hypothetical protein